MMGRFKAAVLVLFVLCTAIRCGGFVFGGMSNIVIASLG